MVRRSIRLLGVLRTDFLKDMGIWVRHAVALRGGGLLLIIVIVVINTVNDYTTMHTHRVRKIFWFPVPLPPNVKAERSEHPCEIACGPASFFAGPSQGCNRMGPFVLGSQANPWDLIAILFSFSQARARSAPEAKATTTATITKTATTAAFFFGHLRLLRLLRLPAGSALATLLLLLLLWC